MCLNILKRSEKDIKGGKKGYAEILEKNNIERTNMFITSSPLCECVTWLVL